MDLRYGVMAEAMAALARSHGHHTEPAVMRCHELLNDLVVYFSCGLQHHQDHGAEDLFELLWLVGLNPEVLAMVQRLSLGKALGRERMFFNLELAVAKYLQSMAAECRV